MATDAESFNRDLYDLLKVRGYDPVPLDSQNQRVSASQDSDVIEFQFKKDGKDYGKAWITIDDAQNIVIYYDEEQQNSPSTRTPGVDYDDSWTGLLKFIKNWAQRRQMSFELANKDRLGDDMRQREYYKMKEKLGEGTINEAAAPFRKGDRIEVVKGEHAGELGTVLSVDKDYELVKVTLDKFPGGRASANYDMFRKVVKEQHLEEGYHAMGKKASYNDAVPNVKIILQHNRALEEGEQRYRNVARIFLENQDGERFLAPTNRPGVARVYARHIAEGGLPNDERWNHIKSVCEDYNKMAGFVRATRNGQFNESAQELVAEGINHYNNLRETLHKMTGHRGYQAYFESWTPTLMENEGDESINELFVQETMDPRIESAMPILSRLRKPVAEMSEVDSLAEWAEGILSEKLEMSEADSVGGKLAGMLGTVVKTGVGTIGDVAGDVVSQVAGSVLGEEESLQSNNPQGIPEGDVIPFKKKHDDEEDWDDDSWIPSIEDFEQEEEIRQYNKNHRKPANDLEEMEKDLYQGRRHDPRKGPQGPDKTAKAIPAKKAAKDAGKLLNKAFKGEVEETMGNTLTPKEGATHSSEATIYPNSENPQKLTKLYHRSEGALRNHINSLKKKYGAKNIDIKITNLSDNLEEDLGPEQQRVGQLGPTEKIGKKGAVGKLVGGESLQRNNEAISEADAALARIKSLIIR